MLSALDTNKQMNKEQSDVLCEEIAHSERACLANIERLSQSDP